MFKISSLFKFLTGCFLFFFVFTSCKEEEKPLSVAEMQINSLQNDHDKWYRYHKTNIDLSSDFLPLGETGDTIGKKAFLEAIITGEFMVFARKPEGDREKYQLIRLREDADDGISYNIAADTYTEYRYLQMEGKTFPEFHFEDLNGRSFSSDELRGKTLVVKTWFIKCKPCIDEMPQLNELVKEYSDREDVVFLSLSDDPEEELEEFLSKTEFRYEVIPNSQPFTKDSLGLTMYPTHLIVDGEGKIRKVAHSAPKMIAFLRKFL